MSGNQLIYLVKLLRNDGSAVDLVETNEFSKAKEVWEESYTKWTDSVADRKPFVVSQPTDSGFMTAFDPSLIREILILPLTRQEESDNPYTKKMNKEGLSSMLGKGISSELTDGGYR